MKKLRNYRRAALFSLLLCLGACWIVFDFLFSPLREESFVFTVPDLCGKSLESVQEEYLELITEYRYDKTVPQGVILSQSPVAGSRKKLTAKAPKCRVTVFVSLGEETVTVPPLVGMDLREAESLLREMGLAVQVKMREGAHTAGEVLASEPRAGAVLPKGAQILLTVSMGIRQEVVTVPNVRGLSRSEALVKLWLSGLTVREVHEAEDGHSDGRVIRQSLQAGTRVRSGSEISIWVSKERYEE